MYERNHKLVVCKQAHNDREKDRIKIKGLIFICVSPSPRTQNGTLQTGAAEYPRHLLLAQPHTYSHTHLHILTPKHTHISTLLVLLTFSQPSALHLFFLFRDTPRTSARTHARTHARGFLHLHIHIDVTHDFLTSSRPLYPPPLLFYTSTHTHTHRDREREGPPPFQSLS